MDARKLPAEVMTFYRRLDEVIGASMKGHAVVVACARGCSLCCNLRVEAQPYEVFVLAAWIRSRATPARLSEITARLRENVAKSDALGEAARRRTNIPCALLGPDGACTAYEARPAECRKFHSTRLATCEASFADPTDDTIESPEHPAVAHNAAVIITKERHAARAAGLDDTPGDLNHSLLEALENPKAERRFRDGKKAFVPKR